MDEEYDQKFEEMKKYIPFLDDMIRRLEASGSGSSNPRQAQLSKIKALRDLLMDKNKRMKLENLLKCEQVLVNLYAKVEHKDTLPGIKSASERSPSRAVSGELDSARQKLNSLQTHQPNNTSDTLPDIERAHPQPRDTLPDIAPANQSEHCTPGSKEPALFQRRQNKSSPSMKSAEKQLSSSSKRNYTRVLVSPEHDSARFSLIENDSDGQPLFQRRDPNKPKSQNLNKRSPKRSPARRQSPSHHKKEKKKSSKSEKNKKKSKTEKLNITLKVPQASLDSLNTENIFDRIINCDDTDVDIGMLRELRSQILGELKETGTNEDISELILRSYSKKKGMNEKTGDVEEGELSDSESEAIDNIYGSLVITEKDSSDQKGVPEDSTISRNIQIRLVISENEKSEPPVEPATSVVISENKGKEDVHLEEVVPKPRKENQSTPKKSNPTDEELNDSLEETVLVNTVDSDITDSIKETLDSENYSGKDDSNKTIVLESPKKSDTETHDVESTEILHDKTENKVNKANFYKPIDEFETLTEDENNDNKTAVETVAVVVSEKIEPSVIVSTDISNDSNPKTESPKIPFLSEPLPKVASPKKDTVSEIEILQALKNDILSETISLPGTEAVTPPLHQPKVTGKVTNALFNDLLGNKINKKKITLENYKQKVVDSAKQTVLTSKAKKIMNLEEAKKIRLTEKELERFNVPSRVSLDDYSSDEDESEPTTDIDPKDVYKDLAPQSPDKEHISDLESDANTTPVIIPAEPVKPASHVITKSDVDMRTFSNPSVPLSSPVLEGNKTNLHVRAPIEVNPPRPVDPRIRKEMGNSPLINPGGTPRPLSVPFPNMTPNARTYEVTPLHSLEPEQPVQNHVYAPSFNSWDREDRDKSVSRDRGRVWERSGSAMRDGPATPRWDNDRAGSSVREDSEHYSRYHSSSRDYRHREPRDPRRRDDGYSRAEGPATPSHYFGRGDCPSTPSHPFGRVDPPRTPVHHFGRSDCPTTPVHPFGRIDAPATPSHPFGRSDCPSTPVHPFGRSDCPTTPIHPFGRGDCPPNHPFGMNEAPRTPSHPFGRSDFKPNNSFGKSDGSDTPGHPFGRSGGYSNDPRNHREFDSRNKYNDGSDLSFPKERFNYNRNSFEKDKQRYSQGDSYKRYNREKSVDRNDKDYSRDQSVDRRREPSAGRYDKQYDTGDYNRGSRSFHEVGTRRPHHDRGQSVGRTLPESRGYRATSRGPSDVRHYRDRSVDKSVSVEPHAGRSFTIDTSVNATFQGASLTKSVINFDDRRKRASSVGRSLAREPSVGRVIAEDFKPSYNKRFYTNKLNNPFARARSVGREIEEVQSERSFKDIKAHFDAYKAESLAAKNTRQDNHSKSESKIKEPRKPVDTVRAKTPTPTVNSRDPRSRKDAFDSQRSVKSNDSKKDSYSPRKNMRDPRVRREQSSGSSGRHNDGKHSTHRSKEHRRSDPRDKKFGIVYTNDNIAKGNVLGPGYGVKNYKIPKIKRPEPEVPPEPEVLPEPEKTLKPLKPTETVKATEPIEIKKISKTRKAQEEAPKPQRLPKRDKGKKDKEKVSAVQQSIEKQVNKNTKEKVANKEHKVSESSDESTPIRTRRSKRNVVCDSDSDQADESKIVLNVKPEIVKTASPKITRKKTVAIESIPENSAADNTEEISNDTSLNFDINDTEVDLFTENMASDNVIDNINDLIADLDKDIGTNKSEDDLLSQITKENTFESILESITSVESSNLLTDNLSQKAPPIIISNEDDTVQDAVTADHTPLKEVCDVALNENADVSVQSKPQEVVSEEPKILTDTTETKESYEEIVSTSNTEKSESELISDNIEQQQSSDNNRDAGSTPDSTIDMDTPAEKTSEDKKDRVPDSTNESQTEMNPHISSTHDSNDQSKETAPEAAQELLTSNPIGSILSLLQDKTKIKELLSMLDDGENSEKIKKKLEKLSELVSDEEDETPSKDNSIEESTKADVSCGDAESEEKSEDVTNKADVIDKIEEMNKEPLIDQREESVKGEIEDKPKQSKKPKRAVKKVGFKKNRRFKKQQKSDKVVEKKRITRSTIVKPKRNRELQNLQNDIRDMFISNEIINATGIRMCRLAKLVEGKSTTSSNSEESSPVKPKAPAKKTETDSGTEESLLADSLVNTAPKVVIEKIPVKAPEQIVKPARKKPGPKSKVKPIGTAEITENLPLKYKPGPKSRKKIIDDLKVNESDPYYFDVSDTNKTTTPPQSDSDSEDESLTSSQSFGSTELLVELKSKTKRKKKGGWKAGVIKKHKRKPTITEISAPAQKPPSLELPATSRLPDLECFTDKMYCFQKRVISYECRLCNFEGEGIVNHYKINHPHYEIPLSRMNLQTAGEAIKQSLITNFQAISKTPMKKYVCRFCYMVFTDKRKNLLEEFFWHVVNNHTGEYDQKCSLCVDDNKCTYMLDIPSAPKNKEGLLMGFICGKCNYTQVSLENLKNHVTLRHNDEETEVYSISLGVLSYVMINALKTKYTADEARSLRSQSKSSESKDDDEQLKTEETPIEKSPTPPPQPTRSVKSKISFETDDLSDMSNIHDASSDPIVKSEKEDHDDDHFNDADTALPEPEAPVVAAQVLLPDVSQATENPKKTPEPELFDQPHFKLNFTETGAKEYVCCIKGSVHYKTALLISMKKHVQIKHSSDLWDGYCSLCKVIVMPQGKHKFTECLFHLLEKHNNDFPVAEKSCLEALQTIENPEKCADRASPKPYINVRPISELIVPPQEAEILPKIESVVSLNSEAIANPFSEDSLSVETPSEETFVSVLVEKEKPVTYEYETFQQSVMSSKHRIVLDAMLTPEKLCHVFKCSGKFCSFTCDLAEDALDHLMTHQRVGGAGLLVCCYCSFDASGNAIDLVTHTFNEHGKCRYSCKSCFYRAATSSLVDVHCVRKHPEITPLNNRVLVASGIQAPPQGNEGILSRTEAVDYYCCNNANLLDRPTGSGEKCKFKTFTAGKFMTHLETAHPGVSQHDCSICDASSPTPTDLVSHLASHGLTLYQCAWCRFGADSERALLEHGSVAHPTRQPQAYLRHIFETKDATSTAPKLKVLPLVHIGRKLQGEPLLLEVPPSTNRENAKREAERAVDLEKLIGHTMQASQDPGPAPSAQTLASEEPIDHPEETIIPDLREPPMETTPPREPVKEEPVEPVNRNNVSVEEVICLDSDDELNSPVKSKDKPIEVTDDGSRRVSQGQVYKCGNCQTISKTGPGMKRHLLYCYHGNDPEMRCAFCQYTHKDRDTIIKHQKVSHGPLETLTCALCNYEVTDEPLMKYHLLVMHKVYRITTKNVLRRKNKVMETPEKPKRPTKRKRSTTETPPVTPTKHKRYGPEDINQLPINQILEESVHCSLCEFNTKVRLNMVRHLQLHAQREPVPENAPVNPVPHLESNEMHFDRMVNLASSSVTNKATEKSKDNVPVVHISPELASRYPKFVTERKRYACGANNCTYISIDETMLKCHWETLHSGSNEYHCVHCPPNQQLDTSRPLTAQRILGHLKMHDVKLYACSNCLYYHHQTHMVEKHLGDKHSGSGSVKIVRDTNNSPAVQTPTAAPTMDLKPWQCGLCNFKSMLRPQVVEHCSKNHNSKFQYKCAFCPWRTSAIENVKKHHMTSHNREAEEFYFYYREGSIPDDEDGTPRWMRQRLAAGLPVQTEVKAEVNPEPTTPKPALTPVNLDLVKKEPEEKESLEKLCERFGVICDPSGLKYKCPLCKSCEDDAEAMRSHLYEELKYRKWGCIFCSYKAFHKTGLKEHAYQEHHNNQDVATELPSDPKIETWVSNVLRHQTDVITTTRENLKNSLEAPSTSKISPNIDETHLNKELAKESSFTKEALESAFGSFGSVENGVFSCPKCEFTNTDELKMKDHLAMELTKVRWCCSACPAKFQQYHQAQLHCKSSHAAGGARPLEALRDPAARRAWLRHSLHSPNPTTSTTTTNRGEDDNSLLKIRFEETIPTPECRKRPADDSDDERLVIDEPAPKKPTILQCKYCDVTVTAKHSLENHTLRHYNLKPYVCPYCTFNGYHGSILKHIDNYHPGYKRECVKVQVPDRPPDRLNLDDPKAPPTKSQPIIKTLTCLICEHSVPETAVSTHSHKEQSQFAEKGDVVYKCCICLRLRINLPRMKDHFTVAHKGRELNYALFKLHVDTREIIECLQPNCQQRFTYQRDLKTHHMRIHGAAEILFDTKKFSISSVKDDSDDVQIVENPNVKRVARKSTTKLPTVLAVAKKSTTKLPYFAYDEEDDTEDVEDFSYYGTKPQPLTEFSNVTTKMLFMNRVMPFTLQKLSEIVNLTPNVRVEDCKK